MFHLNRRSKNELIYKFVYEAPSGWNVEKKTMLVTACSPVEAVRKFNIMTTNTLYNIVEFTEIKHKTEE